MKRRKALKSILSAAILPIVPFKSILSQNECITTSDPKGPFFIDDILPISNIAPSIVGVPRLYITGTVYAKDCVTPIPNALVDVWHANNEGAYEEVNYRGKFYTDEAGNYSFESIQAGKYLNGTQYRPSHIHYRILCENNPEFFTQLYFEGDTTIDIDPWASNPSASERIISLTTDNNENLNGVFDIYLDIDPSTVSLPDYNRNDQRSKLLSISPNPISDYIEVQFFCSRHAKVTIDMCDVSGRSVHILVSKTFQKGIRNLTFKKPSLRAGLYVLRLSIDGLKLDAKRVFIK